MPGEVFRASIMQVPHLQFRTISNSMICTEPPEPQVSDILALAARGHGIWPTQVSQGKHAFNIFQWLALDLESSLWKSVKLWRSKYKIDCNCVALKLHIFSQTRVSGESIQIHWGCFLSSSCTYQVSTDEGQDHNPLPCFMDRSWHALGMLQWFGHFQIGTQQGAEGAFLFEKLASLSSAEQALVCPGSRKTYSMSWAWYSYILVPSMLLLYHFYSLNCTIII